MNKVICIGESLIDFMPVKGQTLTFTAKAGGAPANVCAGVSKLGGKGYYLGRLSNDMFSEFLLDNMHKHGINTDYVAIDNNHSTALAFVALNDKGDRQFAFYRKDTCDLMLDESDVREDMFDKGDALHFCSVSLVESKARYAHVKAIECAIEKQCLVSFDVNVRANLWDDIDDCKKTILQFCAYADIIKVSDDELFLLTQEQDEKKAVAALWTYASRCKMIFVTKGAQGCAAYDKNLQCVAAAAVKSRVIDTTGAGDCFAASILYNIVYKGIKPLASEIGVALDFAMKACAVVVAGYGAMESMPAIDDITKE
ncbi:MAG: carbohydrate kinase [Christensenellales bacterium]